MTAKRSLKVLSVETPRVHARTSVRARTLVHLQQMVAATALMNCSRPVQSDTTITPKASGVDAGSASTTPATVATPAMPPTGYAVVDPMPSPARCYGAASSLSGKAVWKQDATGMFVELTIAPAPPASGVPAVVTGFDKVRTTVMGANMLTSDVRGTSLVLKVRPLAGNTFMSASVGVDCGPGGTGMPGAVVASITLPVAKAKVGDVVAVSLVDR